MKDPSGRNPKGSRLEDAWLVHLHFREDLRPWEIDTRRTGYQGPGLASAHMRTVELVRRLASQVRVDEGFKNIVPALAPGVEPADSLQGLTESKGKREKETKALILDNVAQFREYSAWRAAIERTRMLRPSNLEGKQP